MSVFARLESVYTPKGYPEFESRSLRKIRTANGSPYFVERLADPTLPPPQTPPLGGGTYI